VQLDPAEAMLVRAALHQYVDHWKKHAAADDFASHSREDLEAIRRQAGELIWRLETASAPEDVRIVHSDDAVDPGQA
jgi:hypothetical protein